MPQTETKCPICGTTEVSVEYEEVDLTDYPSGGALILSYSAPCPCAEDWRTFERELEKKLDMRFPS